MPLDITGADDQAAIDEAGHCVNARKRGLHIQFTTIERRQFLRVGITVTGPVTLVNGATNLQLDVQNRVAGTAALLALGATFGAQQDVREAIEKVALSFNNADAMVRGIQDGVQKEMEQPDWNGAIVRAAEHLLVVRTIEESDADAVGDGML